MSNVYGAGYLLAFFAALAFVASRLWHPAPPPKYSGISEWRIPETVAGFQSQGEETLSPSVRAALSSADIVSRTYQSSGGNVVQFTMIGGTDRSALHDPRSCLTGAGWRIEDDHTETIPGTQVQARKCRVVQDKSSQSYELIYLYVVDGKIINEVTQIRGKMLLSALIGQKGTPTIFMRFMRPLAPAGSSEPSQVPNESGNTYLNTFAAEMWNALRPDERSRQQK
jgi:EpsI family protein